MPLSHFLMISISDKDRCTRRSIANMTRANAGALSIWWEEYTGDAGKCSAVWDLDRLIDYLIGTDNMRFQSPI